MNDYGNTQIRFLQLAPDRWVAATGDAPYFCVEGRSQQEAQEAAVRAVKFFWASHDRLGGDFSGQARAPGVRPAAKTVTVKELVAA